MVNIVCIGQITFVKKESLLVYRVMNYEALEAQALSLIHKIRHYLITTIGRVAEQANTEELYRAFSHALREEIMVNWTSTKQTITKNDCRKIYYLSMEYLPGRLFGNSITNLHAHPLFKVVMQKLNRSITELLSCELDPSLGNGGLGRLASCLLDSLATHHYPAQAYGLRYQYGIFEQELWDGVQIERPDCWLLYENPWELRQDLQACSVKFSGRGSLAKNTHGEEVMTLFDFDEVRALPYDLPIIGYSSDLPFSVVTLRLWSTKESPRNFQLQRYNAGQVDQASENTTLTDVLYPNDNHEMGKRTRLKQEFLLVSASLQDIIREYLSVHSDFSSFADKVRIQINDTHPSLIIAELMWQLLKTYDLPWDKAWEITQTSISYTNHTILAEALEEWNQNRFRTLLPCQYHIIEQINQRLCNSLRNRWPNAEDKIRRMSIIENGQVRMANLAVAGSHQVNGVAALHTAILKKTVFKDFYDTYPEKFINVTNGVTQRRWLLHCNPLLAEFITRRIGEGWITDFTQIKDLANYASETHSQKEFLEIKRENKRILVDFLRTENRPRDFNGQIIKQNVHLDVSSLFDVQIKRFHEYKRQLMNALHLIMLYQELRENPNSRKIKRTAIFGGKAAPGYDAAKNIMRLIHCISRKVNEDPSIQDALKVVLIENYNVSRAEMIIPAADLSEQISTAGTEASGTGNMKLAMNGALTIGTSDGANIEMREEIHDKWWPFSFGCTSEEIQQMRANQTYNPVDIYTQDRKIGKALEALRDKTFAIYESEHQIFTNIYYSLLEKQFGEPADRYFVLKDLSAYASAQKKVEDLYFDQFAWAEYAIRNIAGMGKFSTDESIHHYAKDIWHIEPCPLDPSILQHVREEYSEHDKCRILK